MRVMKIKIQSRAKIDKDLLDLCSALDRGQTENLPKVKNGIYFESLKAVRKILTDRRLEVWRTIRDKKPDSIVQLAEILNRSLRAVHRDVILLNELGLIKLNEDPRGSGHIQKLASLYDKLELAVA